MNNKLLRSIYSDTPNLAQHQLFFQGSLNIFISEKYKTQEYNIKISKATLSFNQENTTSQLYGQALTFYGIQLPQAPVHWSSCPFYNKRKPLFFKDLITNVVIHVL